MYIFQSGVVIVVLLVGALGRPKISEHDDNMSVWFEQNERAESGARIVGGAPAPQGSHPHMAALTNGLFVRSFLCGASVISNRHILTAAHCIDAVFSMGSLSSSLRVTVGTSTWNLGGQSYAIASNITHPAYHRPTIKNDIGILVTAVPIELSAAVQPVPLKYAYVGGGVQARVAGFGRVVAGGALSTSLLQIDVPTLSGQECLDQALLASVQLGMLAPPVDPEVEICTFHAPGRGTCNGDSGSALVTIEDRQQIGVVSWGFPCARGAPDMFARVSAFGDWILEATRP